MPYNNLSYKHHTAMGACMPWGITQLPATRQRQHPALTLVGTRFIHRLRMKG